MLNSSQELKDVQVIDGKNLVPKKRGITLRMLLSHTGKEGLFTVVQMC
jgi:hypothetical protein